MPFVYLVVFSMGNAIYVCLLSHLSFLSPFSVAVREESEQEHHPLSRDALSHSNTRKGAFVLVFIRRHSVSSCGVVRAQDTYGCGPWFPPQAALRLTKLVAPPNRSSIARLH